MAERNTLFVSGSAHGSGIITKLIKGNWSVLWYNWKVARLVFPPFRMQYGYLLLRCRKKRVGSELSLAWTNLSIAWSKRTRKLNDSGVNDYGYLPEGIYDCTMEEAAQRFGVFQSSDRRPQLWDKFIAFMREAKSCGLIDAIC